MAIISNITLIEQAEQHVLSVRQTIRFDDFEKVAEEAYQAIAQYAKDKNILFSGFPFVCYHNADLQHLDVELGFPLARPIKGQDNIIGHTIPVQKAAIGLFLGPYTETDPLMMDVFAWIEQNGYEPRGEIYHYYLNDDARPTDELLTQIAVTIK